MRHYDDVEWTFYKQEVLSENKTQEMEEHLYNCDECMDIFLSLINNDEIDEAEEIISKDFTDEVLNSIEKQKHELKQELKTIKRRKEDRFKSIFGYYVAVAAVTIILTWGGFYSSIVDILPQVAEETVIANVSKEPNIISNVSERIVNKTSIFINDFEIYSPKEGLKK